MTRKMIAARVRREGGPPLDARGRNQMVRPPPGTSLNAGGGVEGRQSWRAPGVLRRADAHRAWPSFSWIIKTMQTVLLVIHLMIAAALVGVVLLQKSEGGALGMGGGGSGGFLTGRGTANLLTRVTAGLAAAFFATSIGLTILAKQTAPAGSVFDKPLSSTTGAPATPGAPAASGTTAPAAPGTDAAPAAPAGRGGILDKLQGGGGPEVPAGR